MGYEAEEDRARELGFAITHVVTDGTGNCPYQKALARHAKRTDELMQGYMSAGYARTKAKQLAEKMADTEIKIWHCRDCAKYRTGCCSEGDIKFQQVRGGTWAAKA